MVVGGIHPFKVKANMRQSFGSKRNSLQNSEFSICSKFNCKFDRHVIFWKTNHSMEVSCKLYKHTGGNTLIFQAHFAFWLFQCFNILE